MTRIQGKIVIMRWRDSPCLASLVILSVCVDLAWHRWVGFVRDDAYITFRYSQNIAAGLGFVYNAGEHVYGTSSPGLALVLSTWLRALHNPLPAAIALNILATAMSLIFVWRLLDEGSVAVSQRLLVGLVLIWSDKLLIDMMAGMETPLVIACMMASLFLMMRGKPIAAGLAAGIMLWMRLDSALWILSIAAIFFWAHPRNTLIFALMTSLTYLPWIVFAQLYFGSFIPTTAIAKQVAYTANTQPWVSRFELLSGWLAPFTAPDQPLVTRTLALLTDAAALTGVLFYRRVIWVRALAVFLLLQTTMLIVLSMTVEQRYFTTSLYVLLILYGLGAGVAWSRIPFKWMQGGIVAAYFAIAFFSALPRMIHLRDYQQYVYEGSLVEIGKWLRHYTPSNVVIYLEPLGYVGYYAERKMLDDVGFVPPAVIPFKQQRVDSYTIATSLAADYMVLHCDDAEQAPPDFSFKEVARFDPLEFMADSECADAGLQRNACYQINRNEKPRLGR